MKIWCVPWFLIGCSIAYCSQTTQYILQLGVLLQDSNVGENCRRKASQTRNTTTWNFTHEPEKKYAHNPVLYLSHLLLLAERWNVQGLGHGNQRFTSYTDSKCCMVVHKMTTRGITMWTHTKKDLLFPLYKSWTEMNFLFLLIDHNVFESTFTICNTKYSLFLTIYIHCFTTKHTISLILSVLCSLYMTSRDSLVGDQQVEIRKYLKLGNVWTQEILSHTERQHFMFFKQDCTEIFLV